MKLIISLILVMGATIAFFMIRIFFKFKPVYKKLKLSWKLLLWEVCVLFTVVVSGIIIQEFYIGGWGIKEKLILLYIIFILWWMLFFTFYWIYHQVKKYKIHKN